MGEITPLTWKITTGTGLEAGYPLLFDISSEMTKATNRMARQCGNWKVSKFTITVEPEDSDSDYVALAGQLRYLKPTAARISAIKKGRSSWYKALRAEGMKPNMYHDFRITPLGLSSYANSANGFDGQVYPTIPNLSTLDGVQPLACMQTSDDGYELFTTHNQTLPTYAPTTANMFHDGLNTRLDTVTADADFVMDEEILLPNSPRHAGTDYLSLSFVAHYDKDQGVYSAELTPDPNLYFSLLNGWFEILWEEDNSDTDGSSSFLSDQFDMDVTAYVSGVTRWKRKGRRNIGFRMPSKRKAKKFAKTAWKGYKAYRKYR